MRSVTGRSGVSSVSLSLTGLLSSGVRTVAVLVYVPAGVPSAKTTLSGEGDTLTDGQV